MAINVSSNRATIQPFSRHDLLRWVNEELKGEFRCLEDIGTGASYCQFMHWLFPRYTNLRRVKFYTNLEHEYQINYKILQTFFEKVRVTKTVPITGLVTGNYLDNFEFLQWFKAFFMANYKGQPYDPVAARFGQHLGKGPSHMNNPRNRLPYKKASVGDSVNVAAEYDSDTETVSDKPTRLFMLTEAVEEDKYFKALMKVEEVCRNPKQTKPTALLLDIIECLSGIVMAANN